MYDIYLENAVLYTSHLFCTMLPEEFSFHVKLGPWNFCTRFFDSGHSRIALGETRRSALSGQSPSTSGTRGTDAAFSSTDPSPTCHHHPWTVLHTQINAPESERRHLSINSSALESFTSAVAAPREDNDDISTVIRDAPQARLRNALQALGEVPGLQNVVKAHLVLAGDGTDEGEAGSESYQEYELRQKTKPASFIKASSSHVMARSMILSRTVKVALIAEDAKMNTLSATPGVAVVFEETRLVVRSDLIPRSKSVRRREAEVCNLITQLSGSKAVHSCTVQSARLMTFACTITLGYAVWSDSSWYNIFFHLGYSEQVCVIFASSCSRSQLEIEDDSDLLKAFCLLPLNANSSPGPLDPLTTRN